MEQERVEPTDERLRRLQHYSDRAWMACALTNLEGDEPKRQEVADKRYFRFARREMARRQELERAREAVLHGV